jgi:hypothetical protein
VLSSDKKTSAWSQSCTGAAAPQTETCDATQLDEDCDGQTNEGCQCVNGTQTPCGECGGTALCTNGQPTGKCSKSMTTYYRDADSDDFGDPKNSTLACTKPTGYADNSSDCNDSNGSIIPGYTICNVNDRQYCDSSGTMKTEVCPDGCLNGKCRNDKTTIGKAGWVTCGSSHTTCLASDGCTWPTRSDPSIGTCAGANGIEMQCDGPSDCPSGYVCCVNSSRMSINSIKCIQGNCPESTMYDFWSTVCDPLNPACSDCKLEYNGNYATCQ